MKQHSNDFKHLLTKVINRPTPASWVAKHELHDQTILGFFLNGKAPEAYTEA